MVCVRVLCSKQGLCPCLYAILHNVRCVLHNVWYMLHNVGCCCVTYIVSLMPLVKWGVVVASGNWSAYTQLPVLPPSDPIPMNYILYILRWKFD